MTQPNKNETTSRRDRLAEMVMMEILRTELQYVSGEQFMEDKYKCKRGRLITANFFVPAPEIFSKIARLSYQMADAMEREHTLSERSVK